MRQSLLPISGGMFFGGALLCAQAMGWHAWAASGILMYECRHGSVPKRAQVLMRDIYVFLPEARFYVEVLGPDPILRCLVHDPVSGKQVRQPVLVWDEDKHIVPPPA